jgi:CRISPR-associated protein Csd1
MILQALNDYYRRKVIETDSGMPSYGYGEQKISFCLVLSAVGELVRVVDLRGDQNGKAKPILLTVPLLPSKRTVKPVSNFLWDNTAYVLGAGDPKRVAKDSKRFLKTREEFRSLHLEIAETVKDEALAVLLKFLAGWSPERVSAIEGWSEIQDTNLVFRIEGETGYLHDRPKLREAWVVRYANAAGGHRGACLVTGEEAPIASLHPPIKGVGKQTSGASIVSFNLAAFTSYGKEQSHNAPVGESAAFAYTTGLNYLLRKGSRQRIQLGDAATVFWAERNTPAEDLLSALFDPPADNADQALEGGPSEDRATTALIREVLAAAKAGRPTGNVDQTLDPDIRFHILGLSPNNARLAVRFWNVSTFGDLIHRIGKYFRDIDIEPQFERDPEFPPFWRLTLETAPFHKNENVPPLLAGAFTRAILTGSPYPRSLYTAVLGRIRADRDVNYLRSAVLKACLVRNHQMEVSMSLDSERRDPAYRLGRLFALLEKVQKDATNPTATIRDRYFGAASATPAAVFPQLLRLGQHHISKAEYGGFTDRLIGEVADGIDEFPKHLSLEEQGLFTIGYYHQRNALYRKSGKE